MIKGRLVSMESEGTCSVCNKHFVADWLVNSKCPMCATPEDFEPTSTAQSNETGK
jgi:hypothetical protein